MRKLGLDLVSLVVVATVFATAAPIACTSSSGSERSAGSPAADASVVAVAWTGTASDGTGSIPITFTLSDKGGALTGVQTLFDPTTTQPIKAGPISGQRVGATASWSSGAVSVQGTFAGEDFTGTITFAGALNYPARQASLLLHAGTGAP